MRYYITYLSDRGRVIIVGYTLTREKAQAYISENLRGMQTHIHEIPPHQRSRANKIVRAQAIGIYGGNAASRNFIHQGSGV